MVVIKRVDCIFLKHVPYSHIIDSFHIIKSLYKTQFDTKYPISKIFISFVVDIE